MRKLSGLKEDAEGIIAAVNGDQRFISRITSIGLTPGCAVTVIKNDFLEQTGMIRRVVFSSGNDGHSCDGCTGCGTGKSACAACMPPEGFENMGVMWEVMV